MADHDPDRKVPYLSFSTTTPAREQKFITAILPSVEGAADALPKLELLRGPEMIGARLRRQ